MTMAKIGQERAADNGGLLSKIKEGWENLRIGDGHASAMTRLGIAELRNAFNPSRESVADRDMGLYGSATPGQVDQSRQEVGNGPGRDSLAEIRVAAQEKSKE